MPEKYVCFHVKEWDEFIRGLRTDEADDILAAMPEPVPDAEVFRHQDLVSATVFYSASSTYQSYIELVGHTMTDSELEYMREVVDHFFEAGEKSRGLPKRKLPD
jgi:hypothetical protein